MNIQLKNTAICVGLLASLAVANLALAQNGSTATPAKPAAASTQPSATPSVAAQQSPASGLFSRWDKDKNSTLSLVEFQSGWEEVEAEKVMRQLQETFARRDANKSGGLEATEYNSLELITKAGKSAPPMAKFDGDKNQSLDFREYVAMLGVLLSKP